MSNERARHRLYEEVRQVFSDESADELMRYLPPVGWADVATKADLGVLRNEMDALRAEVRGEMAELRGEMMALRAEVARDLVVGLDRLRVWTIATMLTMTAVISAVVFGASRLGR